MATRNPHMPDLRKFRAYKPGQWLSHRSYRTRKGADAWLEKCKRTHYYLLEYSIVEYKPSIGPTLYYVSVKMVNVPK